VSASPTDAIRLLAFYLPQFHPVPENDSWWGKGFTEWTNVVKARPLFRAHHQPHLPSDLGFYDLRLREAREAQAAMAQSYGVTGFCYYHYWFHGRRLLNRPFDEVLSSGRPDFPFCLCWANENWTRRWDGAEHEVLLQQRYSAEDDRAHIEHLLSAFADSRYIRVDGKPLFLVYRTELLPDPARTAEIWRTSALTAGIGDLYLARVENFIPDVDPKTIGFDAAVESGANGLSTTMFEVSCSVGHTVPRYLGTRMSCSIQRGQSYCCSSAETAAVLLSRAAAELDREMREGRRAAVSREQLAGIVYRQGDQILSWPFA
jgi:hypothetical protein